MEVTPTPEQQALISDAIESGRLHRPEEAVHEALSLWEELERRRAEILAAVDIADASLARGQGRRVASREDTAQFAEDIKLRGLARLSAEQRRADERVPSFWLLARHPYVGRRRDDLCPGLRSFTAGDYVILHRVEEDETVAILYVFHGSRDIEDFSIDIEWS